jgi:hypothetical protein
MGLDINIYVTPRDTMCLATTDLEEFIDDDINPILVDVGKGLTRNNYDLLKWLPTTGDSYMDLCPLPRETLVCAIRYGRGQYTDEKYGARWQIDVPILESILPYYETHNVLVSWSY